MSPSSRHDLDLAGELAEGLDSCEGVASWADLHALRPSEQSPGAGGLRWSPVNDQYYLAHLPQRVRGLSVFSIVLAPHNLLSLPLFHSPVRGGKYSDHRRIRR